MAVQMMAVAVVMVVGMGTAEVMLQRKLQLETLPVQRVRGQQFTVTIPSCSCSLHFVYLHVSCSPGNVIGYTWLHIGTHGCTWTHMDTHEYTWMHPDTRSARSALVIRTASIPVVICQLCALTYCIFFLQMKQIF